MISVAKNATAGGSQITHSTASGPRVRRLKRQQHLARRDDTPGPSSKKAGQSVTSGLEKESEATRPSRLPTLGGRVQSVHQKTLAKSLVRGHRKIQGSTSAIHKAPPLSFDGAFDSVGDTSHQDHTEVPDLQGLAVDRLFKDYEGQVSGSQLCPAQVEPVPDGSTGVSNQAEELLFVSFSPPPPLDIASISQSYKESSKRHGLLYTAPFIASSDHGGHLAASKVQGAAQSHFPSLSHEGHEYPTEEHSPTFPTLAAAPAGINEFQIAMEDLKAVLKTALRLASDAAEQERQDRAEALNRLPGLSSKTLVPNQTHVKNQLKYTRVKTKKKETDSADDKSRSLFRTPLTSPPALRDAHSGADRITLQIPNQTDSLSDIPAIPAHSRDLLASRYGREQGVLPMPPPNKK